MYPPLKEETTAPVRREEPPLDKVQLVVILEEQGRPVLVPGRGPHGLPQVGELCQRLVVVGSVLVVVALDQLAEHLLHFKLLGLLQTKGNHQNCLLCLVHLQFGNSLGPDRQICSSLTSTLEFNSANCSLSS